MNIQNFAEFLTKAGYRVIETPSCKWYQASRFVYLSIPPDLFIDPPEEELNQLFREHRILGVKFCTTADRGKEGALYTLRDKEYDIQSLHIKQRPYVRKGLKRCELKQIDFDYLEKHGMPLNLDTLGRQGRKDPHFQDPKLWSLLCQAGASTDGAGVWGSFVEGNLAAYMIYFIVDGTCHLLHEMSLSQYKKSYPNHAIQFTSMKEMILRDDVRCVSGGFASFLEIESLDRYKRYAGYQKESVQYAVVLRPSARRLLLSRPFGLAIELAHRFRWSRDLAWRVKAIVDIARAS
jgi:hypothetical protein